MVVERDFNQIIGHEFAKRALEIAASGGHYVLMDGPPGCGKSLLAETFPLGPSGLINRSPVGETKSLSTSRCSLSPLSLPFTVIHIILPRLLVVVPIQNLVKYR